MKRATLVLLALVPALLFADVLLGFSTFYIRDVALYHFPGKHVLREIVLGGEFPYWSPYISAGQPLAANPVHQVFYPLTWLILLPDFLTAFNVLALIHVYLALFGMYALLRSMRVRRAAAAFAGLSYGVGGLMVSLLNLFPLLYSAAWLPVTCLFTRRFLISRGRRDFAFAALSLAMQLLIGEPVTALQTGIILGAYAMTRGWRKKRAWRNLASVAAISLTALLLASVQLLPAVDHLRESGRGRGISFEEITEWSTPPLRLVEPLFPDILGRWTLGPVLVYPSMELFGTHRQPLYFSIYAGLAVAVFVLTGWFARVRGALLAGILALISTVLALGGHTPLFRMLYETGVLRFVRFPEKFLTMGAFVAIVFAACVLERLLAGDARLRRVALAVAGAVTLFALGAAAAGWLPTYESLLRRLYRIDATANIFDMVAVSQKHWLLVAMRGTVLFLLVRSVMHVRRAWWTAFFLAFVLLDLLPQIPEIAPRMPRAFLDEEPPVVKTFPPNRHEYRIFPLAGWVDAAGQAPKAGPPDDLLFWEGRNELPAQLGAAYGLRSVLDGDLDASDLRAERDFGTAAMELAEKNGRPADWIDILAAMSNARFVSFYRRPEEIAAMPRGLARGMVRFVERPPSPRYYFASELVTIGDRHEFVRALRSRRFSRQVAFVHQPAFAPAPGVVHSWRETANHARIDVEARGLAFLVMSVTPHKNWRITIDGNDAAAVIANIGYQGVVVPPGRHLVEMRYRDPLVAAGGAVSAAALLALTFVAGPLSRRNARTVRP